MIEHITPQRIANSIQQDKGFTGTYLVVEGHNDFLVYAKFTDKSFCEIKIAHGFSNVLEVIDILKKRGFESAIGIIDADFRIIDNEKLEHEDRVFLTDDHDLEMMLFKSEAFESIIRNYAKEEKVNEFLREKKKDLRNIILDIAKPLAVLRWINKTQNLGLVFKPPTIDGNPLNYTGFISPTELEFLGNDAMVQTIINYSRNKSNIKVTLATALREIEKFVVDNTVDLYQLCHGHDVANIVSISFRKKLSNKNSSNCRPDQIEKDLVLAFDSRDFQKTRLFQRIKQWEQSTKKSLLKF